MSAVAIHKPPVAAFEKSSFYEKLDMNTRVHLHTLVMGDETICAMVSFTTQPHKLNGLPFVLT